MPRFSPNVFLLLFVLLGVVGCSKFSNWKVTDTDVEQTQSYATDSQAALDENIQQAAQALGYSVTSLNHGVFELRKDSSVGLTTAQDVISQGFFNQAIDHKQAIKATVRIRLKEDKTYAVTIIFDSAIGERSTALATMFFAKLDQKTYLQGKRE